MGLRPSARKRSLRDDELVLGRLLAGVGQEDDLGAGQLRDQLGQVAHAVGLGRLVEHRDALAGRRRVVDRDLDAAHRVADVDERPRLAARAVHRQGVADGGLHQEAVEHRAVVAVVVEAVDEPLVEGRLVGLRAPDDPLVQVGDPDAVVLRVEGERAAGRASWSCGTPSPGWPGAGSPAPGRRRGSGP